LFIGNQNDEWKNINQIIKIERIKEFKNSDRPTESANRYYISSLGNKARQYQKNIRSHWGAENKLHWTFGRGFQWVRIKKKNWKCRP